MTRRLASLLLAALTVLAILTPATSTAGAQDRVRAFHLATLTHAGATATQSPWTRPGSIEVRARIAAGCCVAAKAEDEAARLAKALQGGGRAPELSKPYGIHTILDDAGNVKQVTTYDRFGRRAHQYDVGPGTRHGEGSHTFEYGPGSERGARGEHVPF